MKTVDTPEDQPLIIKEPFSTVYDVTDETPVDKIPKEWWNFKQKFKDEADYTKALQLSVEQFSKCPDIEDLLIEQAHQTISKFDDNIIKVVFHVGLSAYFKPLNLGLKAESGSGKSYSTVETLKFLPSEDIEEIGSQSPKVISHQNGVRKTRRNGRVLDEANEPKKPSKSDYPDPVAYQVAKQFYDQQKAEWDQDIKDSYFEVDLRNKILVFLESVNLETFKMFKTTMSHDGEYIDHKYVDDRGNVHVTRLVGAPAMIFNSVDNSYVEEFATRTLSATPSTKSGKIADSMDISNKKSAYPWIYDNEPFNRKIITEYIRKVKSFLNQGKIKVAVPFEGLKDCFSKDAVRDMRDFNKFLELVPSYAIFKLFQRPIVMIQGQRYLIPTIQDALDAKQAFDAILETTKTSTDYRVIEFYNTIVSKHKYGAEAEELADEFNKNEKRRSMSIRRIREWLTRLEEIGYVDVREATHENIKGYIDRRFNNYVPLKEINTANKANFQIDTELNSILIKGFELWIKNAPIQNDIPIIILNIDGTAKPISLEEMKDIILNNKKMWNDINDIFLTANQKPIDKIKPKNMTIAEIAVNAAFSRYVQYEYVGRKPGVICSAYECQFEAEYTINDNLFCETHFKEQVKLLQDNGTGLKPKDDREAS